ncbi:uncharacterized protein LOC136028142 [Artemia franciscana]|uniref:uncharacterized protein LOC136028142 n=1 Tax=Artemia franciscana TaxID=6661 RepID=UPI0032DBDA21
MVQIILFLFFCPYLSVGYRTLYLDEPSICSPLSFKKSVNLNKLSAVIIRLTRFKAPNPLFHKCHLEFEAPKGFGVVAVIEEAKLRLTGYDSCHDYVQFGRDDGRISKEICGVWNYQSPTVLATLPEDQKNISEVFENPFILQDNGRNTTIYHDPDGELHLWFHRGLGKSAPHSTAIKIVVSVYKKGCHSLDQNFFMCPGSFDQAMCIPRQFQCDSHVNCGNGTLHDETDCAVGTQRVPNPVLSITQIIVGMTIVFAMILVTGVVFWCCCCRLAGRQQSQAQARNVPASASEPLRPLPTSEVVGDRIALSNIPKETIDRAALDLPPSYDELFPGGRTPSGTDQMP